MASIDISPNTFTSSAPGGYVLSREMVKGGFQVVETNLSANAITNSNLNTRVKFTRRDKGMLVYDTSSNTFWKCDDRGTDDSTGLWSQTNTESSTPELIDGGTY